MYLTTNRGPVPPLYGKIKVLLNFLLFPRREFNIAPNFENYGETDMVCSWFSPTLSSLLIITPQQLHFPLSNLNTASHTLRPIIHLIILCFLTSRVSVPSSCLMLPRESHTKTFPTGIEIWCESARTFQLCCAETRWISKIVKSKPNQLCFTERRTFR